MSTEPRSGTRSCVVTRGPVNCRGLSDRSALLLQKKGGVNVRTTNAGRFTTAIVVVLAELATGQAAAQTDDLTEVVVTARKRDESFQNVPMTVNVLTEQTIQSAGIESPRDFIALVPNMTLVETQNA